MKAMKIFSISAMIIAFVSATLVFIMAVILIHYYLGKLNIVREHLLVIWVVELITGFIYLSLMKYEHKIAKKMKESGEPYILDLNKEISYETLCNTLKKHKYFSNCFNIDESSVYKTVCKTISKHDVYKYYVFKMEEYNKIEYKKLFKDLNETYKKKYKEKDTFYGSQRHARFIFIFVDRWSKDAEELVHHFQRDLQRVETSMTYIIYNHKIYLSPIYCDFVNDGAYRYINKEAKKVLDMVK